MVNLEIGDIDEPRMSWKLNALKNWIVLEIVGIKEPRLPSEL